MSKDNDELYARYFRDEVKQSLDDGDESTISREGAIKDLRGALPPRNALVQTKTTRTVVIGSQNKVVVREFYTDGNPCLFVDFPKGAAEIRVAAMTMLDIANALEGN